jgi:hypothetical protein
LAGDFQQKVAKCYRGNILVTSSLDFGASSSQIEVINDDSEQRPELLNAGVEMLSRITKGRVKSSFAKSFLGFDPIISLHRIWKFISSVCLSIHTSLCI